MRTVDPRARHLGQGPGNSSGEGFVPHSQAAEVFARLNLNQIHQTNDELNTKKVLELEACDRDNTKSCSSKSAQISPISQTVINPRDRPEAEDMPKSTAAHAQDLKGNLKDMIQTEIQRLQVLYQNIDSLLQEGKPQ
jgi:protein subunit release factor A